MDASYLDLVRDLLKSGDVDAALNALRQAVEKGDSQACRYLGNLYMEGRYVSQDVDRAKAYYIKGAQLGDSECADRMAMPVIRVGKHGEMQPTKQNIRDLYRLASKGYADPLIILTGASEVFPRFFEDHTGQIRFFFEQALDQHPERVDLRIAYAYFLLARNKDPLQLKKVLEILQPLVENGMTEGAVLYLDVVMRFVNIRNAAPVLDKALSLIRKAHPDLYYMFSGYFCLLNLDGPGAFALFEEGSAKKIDQATVGLGYCYLHGIGTSVDHQKAKELLEPHKHRFVSVPAYLARIEMLEDPQQPHIDQAMNYLNTAEDMEYSYFYEDLCSWLLMCKQRQIPLDEKWDKRLVEICDEGLCYGSDSLAEWPMIAELPLSEEALACIKDDAYIKEGEAKSPMGLFHYMRKFGFQDYGDTNGCLFNLVGSNRLDWDLRCEWAITALLSESTWLRRKLFSRGYYLDMAKKLSQGRYDKEVLLCQHLSAILDGLDSHDASAEVDKFLSCYLDYKGEPVAEYLYAWIEAGGLLGELDRQRCAERIRRIPNCSIPYFHELRAELLDRVGGSKAFANWLRYNGKAYMERELTARMLCGITAMPLLHFEP